MKRVAILLSLIVLFVASCAKSELGTQVSDVSSTPCKQEVLKSGGLSDNVVVEFTNAGVHITHYNFEVPCDFTTVNVTHTFVNGVLRVTQQGPPNQADCVCYTDVSYTINGILQNEVNVIFINGVQVYCHSEPLSDEQISFNLSINGKTDPELLIGEWDAIKFAYTADGHKISDVVNIKSAQLEIPVAPTSFECEVYDPETGVYTASETWKLHVINGSGWLCSLSGKSIKFSFCGQTKINVPCPHEEWDIFTAFYNAYSFVIKGNELMIFFTEDKDSFFGDAAKRCSIAGEEKMNLIIFKKR